jgi:hypothetical protein
MFIHHRILTKCTKIIQKSKSAKHNKSLKHIDSMGKIQTSGKAQSVKKLNLSLEPMETVGVS